MKRSDYFTLRLLTKPYLKKYIECLFGKPLVFTTSNFFGDILASTLSKPNITREKNDIIKHKADRFDTSLEIFCPLWFLKKNMYGHDINDKQMVAVNKLFDDMFTVDLFRFCYMMSLFNVSIEDAIYEFCKVYDLEIDTDITFDALKQNSIKTTELLNPKRKAIQIPMF
jgi:hypothetical protein